MKQIFIFLFAGFFILNARGVVHGQDSTGGTQDSKNGKAVICAEDNFGRIDKKVAITVDGKKQGKGCVEKELAPGSHGIGFEKPVNYDEIGALNKVGITTEVKKTQEDKTNIGVYEKRITSFTNYYDKSKGASSKALSNLTNDKGFLVVKTEDSSGNPFEAPISVGNKNGKGELTAELPSRTQGTRSILGS